MAQSEILKLAENNENSLERNEFDDSEYEIPLLEKDENA